MVAIMAPIVHAQAEEFPFLTGSFSLRKSGMNGLVAPYTRVGKVKPLVGVWLSPGMSEALIHRLSQAQVV